jgi:hypothetical protein
MTFIFIFAAASTIASLFTIAACMLSSQLSQQERLMKAYADIAKPIPVRVVSQQASQMM